uniref:Uncharacterized protein n=1 Tax=Tetradesmus obliquus TaxID=3088 RepID=A0A383VV24_TETOB|eukprot:jgi/Sobl393_1/6916/SZX69337.1
MNFTVPLLALALALCLGSALANDLQVKVYNCRGEIVSGARVRISGCVDDGLTGPGSIGISTTTNSNGIASFLEHKENSIQFCWGSAKNLCKIEVVGGAPSGVTYPTLSLRNATANVTPRQWICQAKQCCQPCRSGEQEPGCTRLIDYGTTEIRPNPSSCAPACPNKCFGQVRFLGFIFTVEGKCEDEGSSRKRALLQDGGATLVPEAEPTVLDRLPEGDVLEFYNPEDGSWVPMSLVEPAAEAATGRRRLSQAPAARCRDLEAKYSGTWFRTLTNCPNGGDCGRCCQRR